MLFRSICDVAGRCAWEVNGGTSATAPGVAAGIALIMQRLAGPDGVPVRLGQLNQALYGAAATDAAAGGTGRSPLIRDIVSGSNDVHGIGCCSAVPGYDAATGWGVIDFSLAARTLQPVHLALSRARRARLDDGFGRCLPPGDGCYQAARTVRATSPHLPADSGERSIWPWAKYMISRAAMPR